MKKHHYLRRRGIYLLPNLLTTMGLFFGFYAIVAALTGYFNKASMAIFIGMIFDGLDGRIARLTNTTSSFGTEYDSLSDMVTFGIAPALFAYSWGLHSLGKIGWLVAFIYAAATALRLARFNTQIAQTSGYYFRGLPSPAAAAVIAGMIWTADISLGVIGKQVSIIVAVIIALMAALMVSSVPYYSFKKIDLKGRVPFVMILLFILLCAAITINPPLVLFVGFLLFTISGPVTYLFHLGRKKKGMRHYLFKKSNNKHLKEKQASIPD